MDIFAAVTTGKTLLELSQEIAKVIKQAQNSPDVEHRVLYYLNAAQASVVAMRSERQKILTDARKCDISKYEEIDPLWQRLDGYMLENNIRPQLDKAIQGLKVCNEAILKEARVAWRRKRDKEAAVETFSKTLNELESMQESLTSDPGGSGMGVQTLMPILWLTKRVRDDIRLGNFQTSDVQMIQEDLDELVRQALHDDSNEMWFRMNGKVEALVAELQLAFSLKID